jgi:ABC-type nitrate/sulfonate/bicarbonate transport system permease component
MRRRVGLVALELAVPVALVAAYQWWAARGKNPYFPTVGRIASAFRKMWFGDGFRDDVLPSLSNLAKGYLGGLVLGIAAGVVLWRVPLLRRALSPVISFVLTLPPVALVPLFIVAFSIGTALQVGIILYAAFFAVAVTTADALRSVDHQLVDMAASFRVRGWRRLVHVMLPAAAPAILGVARSTLGVSLLVMIVSELVGASQGIGVATLTAQQSFQYPEMWAGMVLLAVLGYLLNRLFSLVERPILRRVSVAEQLGTVAR